MKQQLSSAANQSSSFNLSKQIKKVKCQCQCQIPSGYDRSCWQDSHNNQRNDNLSMIASKYHKIQNRLTNTIDVNFNKFCNTA
eukprot:scaffold404907_cov19-Prasinocladus_malaysianus.AAC.1